MCVVVFYLSAVKIVDSKDGTSLINIFQERISLGFTGLLVSDEVDPGDLSVLRNDTDDIALGQVVGQSADKDMCRVLVLLMPGSCLGMGS